MSTVYVFSPAVSITILLHLIFGLFYSPFVFSGENLQERGFSSGSVFNGVTQYQYRIPNQDFGMIVRGVELTESDYRAFVDGKIFLWKSLMRCSSKNTFTVHDNLIPENKITYRQSAGCGFIVNINGPDMDCDYSPDGIQGVIQRIKSEKKVNLGIEYLITEERGYLEQNCRVN